jgi:hypothetical protein
MRYNRHEMHNSLSNVIVQLMIGMDNICMIYNKNVIIVCFEINYLNLILIPF